MAITKLLVKEEDFQKFKITDEQFGPVLLSRLGRGLYKNPLHCIREYIQNAVDGINKYNRENKDKTDKIIRVVTEGNTIVFHDNGVGMNYDDILSAISFGVSLKEKIYDAGFLGIGIFSGAAVADKMRMYTTKKGEKKGQVFEIDYSYIEKNYSKYKSGLELLKDATKFQEIDEDDDKHYCKAILYINKDYKYLLQNDNEIRRYISNVCPVNFPSDFEHNSLITEFYKKYGIEDQIFNIRLNKKPVYRLYPTGVKKPQFKEVKYNGQLLAAYWYCENKDKGFILGGKTEEDVEVNDIRYITFRLWNFLLDDPNRRDYAARELFGGRPDLMRRYFGDIHVLNFEKIEPDLERTGIRHTDAYEQFKTAIIDKNNTDNILSLREEAYRKSSQSALVKVAQDAGEYCEDIQTSELSKMKEEDLWAKKHALKERKNEITNKMRRGGTYNKLTTPDKKKVNESLKTLEKKEKEISTQITEHRKDKTEFINPDFSTNIKIELNQILEIIQKHLKDHGSIYNSILKDLRELVKKY